MERFIILECQGRSSATKGPKNPVRTLMTAVGFAAFVTNINYFRWRAKKIKKHVQYMGNLPYPFRRKYRNRRRRRRSLRRRRGVEENWRRIFSINEFVLRPWSVQETTFQEKSFDKFPKWYASYSTNLLLLEKGSDLNPYLRLSRSLEGGGGGMNVVHIVKGNNFCSFPLEWILFFLNCLDFRFT